MSNTHTYYITGISGMPGYINKIERKINLDPQLSDALDSISYVSPYVTSVFNRTLTDDDKNILQLIMDTIFYMSMKENNKEVRTIYSNNNVIPTNEFDRESGYRMGSLIYNNDTKTVYQCISSQINNSIWISSNNTCYAYRDNSFGTISIQSSPLYSNIPLTNIQYSNGDWSLDTGEIIIGSTGYYDISYSITVKFINAPGGAIMVSSIISRNNLFENGTQKTIMNDTNDKNMTSIFNRCVVLLNKNDKIILTGTASGFGAEIPNNIGLFPAIASNIAYIIVKQI